VAFHFDAKVTVLVPLGPISITQTSRAPGREVMHVAGQDNLVEIGNELIYGLFAAITCYLFNFYVNSDVNEEMEINVNQDLTTESLINAIQIEPAIWDSEFNSSEEKDLAWKQIYDIFGTKNGKLSEAQ